MKKALTSRQKRLRFSIMGFGVLAGVLSMGLFVVLASLPASLYAWAITGFSVPATLAMTLTSMLFWWLFIVRPNRLTLRRGVLAGIVSTICAIPLTWVFVLGYDALPNGPLAFISLLGIVPNFTVISFFLLFFPAVGEQFPWWIGWIMLLIGGSAGGLFALLLRSIFHVTDEVEHSELALAVTPAVEQAHETTPPTQAEQGEGVVPTVQSTQPPAPVTAQHPSFTADRLQETLQPARRGLSRRTVIVGLGLTGLVAAGGGITWRILIPHPLFTYRGHSLSVTAVAWSPDGERIDSGSADKTVQVWQAE